MEGFHPVDAAWILLLPSLLFLSVAIFLALFLLTYIGALFYNSVSLRAQVAEGRSLPGSLLACSFSEAEAILQLSVRLIPLQFIQRVFNRSG